MKRFAYKITTFLLVAAMFTGSVGMASRAEAAKKTRLKKKVVRVEVGKTVKIKLLHNKKKVKWTVKSGKKRIAIKVKKKKFAVVKGRKPGIAKVQAKVGKKKFVCRVIVKAPSRLVPMPEVKEPVQPTKKPGTTAKPTLKPTTKPTGKPTAKPTGQPTAGPTAKPTGKPTAAPTANPTGQPTAGPTTNPTTQPTPTVMPTLNPDYSSCVDFTMTEDNYTQTGLKSLSGAVEIPATFTSEDGTKYKVSKLGDGLFAGNEEVTSVEIPDSVTEIGNEVFLYASALSDRKSVV